VTLRLQQELPDEMTMFATAIVPRGGKPSRWSSNEEVFHFCVVHGINQFMDVSARTGVGATVDPQRLRYLTKNFTALQGLNSVVIGVVFLLPPIGDVYSWPIHRWFSLIALAAVVAVARYIPRYLSPTLWLD